MKTNYLMVLLAALLLVGCAAEQATTEPESTAPAETTPVETAPAAPAEPVAEEVAVDIMAAGFDPAEVSIKPGDIVTWTNTNDYTIMFAGPKKMFSEKVLAGESFSFTFEEAGEYEVLNIVPATFTGKVMVGNEEAAEDSE